MKLGIDVSTLIEERKAEAQYFINDKLVEPLQVFAENNVELVRIRLWVDPYKNKNKPYLGGTNDLETFIEIAKAAKKLNYQIVLDFHYSDFWADPGKQFLPKAWINLSFEQLLQQVYDYTHITLNTIKEEGIDLVGIQVGNEITNGFLWPHGQLIDQGPSLERSNYPNFIKLIKSSVKACREIYKDAKIILHLERSHDKEVYEEFFTKMTLHNVDYDVIGVSYYPYWHGTFEQLFANLDNCKNLFNKEIMIMECGYSFTIEDYILEVDNPQLVINSKMLEKLKETLPHPLTADGQKLFVRDFLNKCRENEISAVFYWEPAWIPGKTICWSSKEGQEYIRETHKSTRNEWSNQCLFDYDGKALPAFYEFKNERK